MAKHSRMGEYREQFVKDLDPSSPGWPATLGDLSSRLKTWRATLQSTVEDSMPPYLRLEDEARNLQVVTLCWSACSCAIILAYKEVLCLTHAKLRSGEVMYKSVQLFCSRDQTQGCRRTETGKMGGYRTQIPAKLKALRNMSDKPLFIPFTVAKLNVLVANQLVGLLL